MRVGDRVRHKFSTKYRFPGEVVGIPSGDHVDVRWDGDEFSTMHLTGALEVVMSEMSDKRKWELANRAAYVYEKEEGTIAQAMREVVDEMRRQLTPDELLPNTTVVEELAKVRQDRLVELNRYWRKWDNFDDPARREMGLGMRAVVGHLYRIAPNREAAEWMKNLLSEFDRRNER